MFVELMPMLTERTVMITVSRVNQNFIRVNFIPSKKKEDENAALATPLSFSGTPKELDRNWEAISSLTWKKICGSKARSPQLRQRWRRLRKPHAIRSERNLVRMPRNPNNLRQAS